MRLERLTAADAGDLVEPLFQEYGLWVLGRLQTDLGRSFAQADLERHHEVFRVEFAKLTGPRGRLLVAWVDDEAVGVGGLKPIDPETAEIKRMYVRPAGRGRGVGRALLERLLADARTEGYLVARLESLRFMTDAHALYRSCGFVDSTVFDGSEAAMSGLEDVTYFMELKL